ncbi:MAG TPA: LD-carboxypeptidase [Methanomassiliicoccales archaeon]|nr:LD-carboxypeptidase [Methanomassiliicoccales archaeon]
MQLVRPKRLSAGDRIGIVAPGSSASIIEPRVWDQGLRNLRQIGQESVVGRFVMERNGHTAGTVDQRLEDLHDMFPDPDIAGVMTVFAGFNSN